MRTLGSIQSVSFLKLAKTPSNKLNADMIAIRLYTLYKLLRIQRKCLPAKELSSLKNIEVLALITHFCSDKK